MQKAVGILAAALAVAGLVGACGAETQSDARGVAQANADAVVNVQIVVEMTTSYGGESEKEENRTSVTGTVIDPSGLVVTSLSGTDPSHMISMFMGEDDSDFKMSAEIVDLKIKTSDGTEIPADMVLRDPDLDLAFIKPKKAPEKPLAYVDLSQSSVPQLLQEMVLLSRLGKVADYSLYAAVEPVHAVVTKPRTFYVAGMYSSFGGPAFALDGKPVGILVLRSAKGDSARSMFSGYDDMMAGIVLPSSTVLKIAEQAKTAVPQE
ncbi:MAG: hypothetical protein A2Z18_01920 [Armatimonadetes bacterium RBG_16_58_9]|nr:MAG: hypothetical protein A2Z18_01920 [Armatimonadetes bacterium RBG_16_58_9]